MMVGYGLNYPQYTYRVLKVSTKIVITARYVIWINILYGDFKRNEDFQTIPPEIKIQPLCKHRFHINATTNPVNCHVNVDEPSNEGITDENEVEDISDGEENVNELIDELE